MTAQLFDFVALQALAIQFITASGAPYKLLRPHTNGTDTVLVTNTPGTFDKQVNSLVGATAGGVIASDKKVIYLPVLRFGAVEPKTGDRLVSIVNPKQGWRIQEVEVERPDGRTTIYYTCTVT